MRCRRPRACRSPARSRAVAESPSLILHNGRITTLDRANPVASAVAVTDGRFSRVGCDEDVLPLAGPGGR